MSYNKSLPIDDLLQSNQVPEADIIIVGSGYGGSVAALRLANPKLKVWILERGQEYQPGDFPEDIGEIAGHVRVQNGSDNRAYGYPDALFDFRLGRDVDVIQGSGLGGTSLINASVAARPDNNIFKRLEWPKVYRENPAVLNSAYTAVKKLLGVETSSKDTAISKYDKFAALDKLSSFLNKVENASCVCSPADITVSLDHCTNCGNCVTGCNEGAKKSLDTSLIPLAILGGARFFTGASVLSLESAPKNSSKRWMLRIRKTKYSKPPLNTEVHRLYADTVILAAGSLGSTEILLRSQEMGKLALSGMLGQRFSTNGDGLAMTYAQKNPVKAVASSSVTPGPTICGLVRFEENLSNNEKISLTIEDGAIPTALHRVFSEIITTAAQLNRLGDNTLPEYFKSMPGLDPIRLNNQAINRSQVLLIMGQDQAKGKLCLKMGSERPKLHALDQSSIAVEWPQAAKNAAICNADRILQNQNLGRGLDGGQYVSNPFWRLLPDRASKVLSGNLSTGKIVTVHPLGGCSMGDNVHTGVVNDIGQVFRYENTSSDTMLYDGLYVLDGAIIPGALGVNPFLTIAALAWRACDDIEKLFPPNEKKFEPIPHVKKHNFVVKPEIPPVSVTLKEQFVGQLESLPKWLGSLFDSQKNHFASWEDEKGLVLEVELPIKDFSAWLSGTSDAECAIEAKAKLYQNVYRDCEIDLMRPFYSPAEHLHYVTGASGTVRLLTPDYNPALRCIRAVCAIYTYLKRNENIWNIFKRVLKNEKGKIGDLWKIALMHASYRRLSYFFTLDDEHSDIVIKGSKLLAWRAGNPRLWDTLIHLPIRICDTRKNKSVAGKLLVDLEYYFKDGAPQVVSMPNTPALLMDLASFGMLFFRAILQTNFWEFRAFNYPSEPIKQFSRPLPLVLKNRQTIHPQILYFTVPISESDSRKITLSITRYKMESHAFQDGRKSNPKALLLIHGLAQGSQIYCTDTLYGGNSTNMAAYMLEQQFDVWMLDHRLSNALPSSIPFKGWNIEEIAHYDIPAAVKTILAVTGGEKINIFAHCVGATATAMAVLKGWLPSKTIESISFNAIHPWIIPSPANRIRAKLGSFLRDSVQNSLLDPIPQSEPTVVRSLLDRLAASFARIGEAPPTGVVLNNREQLRRKYNWPFPVFRFGERHAADGGALIDNAVCDHMTFLYSRMWRHHNLAGATHSAFTDLVGRAPASVYRQLYYLAYYGHITDCYGRNVFLTSQNIRRNWSFPTLFLHGKDSDVFNSFSAWRSAKRLKQFIANNIKASYFNSAITCQQIGVNSIDNFGHMDVIFAEKAEQRVFPKLSDFFNGNYAFDEPDEIYKGEIGWDNLDIHFQPSCFPVCGPILRCAQIDKNSKNIWMRFWMEFEDKTPLQGIGIQVFLNDQEMELISLHSVLGEPSTVWVDVNLGKMENNPEQIKFSLSFSLKYAEESRVESDNDHKIQFSCLTMPWLKRLIELRCGREKGKSQMRFLVGSCRYPGTLIESGIADKVFSGMLSHVIDDSSENEDRLNKLPKADLVFFIGDQIYADATANIIDRSIFREKYDERYRYAFCSTYFRKLAHSVAIHFAIDDHEFSDNWSGLPNPPDKTASVESKKYDEFYIQPLRDEYRYALSTAKKYMGANRDYPESNKLREHQSLWYGLEFRDEAQCPSFVLDTRSERSVRTAETSREEALLFSDIQFNSLKKWLLRAHADVDSRARPKFIFSGSVIAPIERACAQQPSIWRDMDGWIGYPATLCKVLKLIAIHQIKGVVFVGGDLHFSSVSHLTIHYEGYKEIVATQIVASGLFAPLPFVNSKVKDYDWNSVQETKVIEKVSIKMESGILCDHLLSQFVHVDAEVINDIWRLTVTACDADGREIVPKGRPPGKWVQLGSRWRQTIE